MPSAAPFILFVQTAAGRLLQTISNYFKLAQSEPKYFKGHRIEPASCFYELKLFLWSRYEMYKRRKLDNRFGFEKLHHILPLFWLVAWKCENTPVLVIKKFTIWGNDWIVHFIFAVMKSSDGLLFGQPKIILHHYCYIYLCCVNKMWSRVWRRQWWLFI